MKSGRLSRAAVGTISFGLAVAVILSIVAGAGSPFTTPMPMGYPPGGDDWEPAVASDGVGNVYYLTTHFGGVPGCGACADPTIVVQVSHDAGRTFSTTQINQNTLGWPLNGGATATADGTVYMVWELVHKSGQAQGPQDVAVTKSADGGATWTLSYVDTGLPPGPACVTFCGWDFLGTGAAIATDLSGNVYVTYNAPLTDNGPPHVWYRSSTDGGVTWSARIEVSADATPSFHVFPGVAAGGAGG